MSNIVHAESRMNSRWHFYNLAPTTKPRNRFRCTVRLSFYLLNLNLKRDSTGFCNNKAILLCKNNRSLKYKFEKDILLGWN